MGPSLGAAPTVAVVGRCSAEDTCRGADAEVGGRGRVDDADAARGGRLGVNGRRNGIPSPVRA